MLWAQLTQVCNGLLGQPIAEVLLPRVIAQILERQDRKHRSFLRARVGMCPDKVCGDRHYKYQGHPHTHRLPRPPENLRREGGMIRSICLLFILSWRPRVDDHTITVKATF